MFAKRLTFNPRSKATDIGYPLSLGTVFGCCIAKSGIYVVRFEDSPEDRRCLGDGILKMDMRAISIIVS